MGAIDDVSFTPDCIIEQTATSSTHPTTSSTQSTPTSTRSTPTSSKSTHTSSSPMSPTTELATSAPSNPHKHTATIAGVVVGVLLVIAIVAAVIITLYKRNIELPGIRALQSVFNPNYTRMENSGMVSLQELSSR